MSSSVDQIKSKIDIVTLISSYIKLEKAGTNFKGKCPFHNEKTPSFFVSPDRGSYYCFGCQAKGDIFTFVEEFEGLDFVGALKVLAERAGVTLDQYHSSEKSEKDRLYSVLEQAVFFYQKKLDSSKEALAYLHKRGVTSETIKEFRIGFAPLEWRELFTYLTERSVTPEDMLEVGLIKKKDDLSGSLPTFYDTFRGRIMFPINDSSGRCVGFSGRILIDDPSSSSGQVHVPKYLNSPETTLFNKSDILFGLDLAKKDIRLKDYSVLVEGQMDLIMLHQVGIKNTVASSGTALTERHLVRLCRLSNRLIMAYDGDMAGFSASNRSSQIALSLGMELKIAHLPTGKDPADLAIENPEKLKECLKNSKHIIDFYIDTLLTRSLPPRELGLEIQKNVLPYLALLPSSIEKAHFIKIIVQKTFINETALWDDLKKVEMNKNVSLPPFPEASPPKRVIEEIERKIFGFIMWQRSLKGVVETTVVDLKKIEKKIEEILGKKWKEIIAELEKEKESLLFETEAYYNNKTNLEKEISELLLRLEEEYLKKEIILAMSALQEAEQKKDKGGIKKYLEDCQRISQRINAIKKIYEKQ